MPKWYIKNVCIGTENCSLPQDKKVNGFRLIDSRTGRRRFILFSKKKTKKNCFPLIGHFRLLLITPRPVYRSVDFYKYAKISIKSGVLIFDERPFIAQREKRYFLCDLLRHFRAVGRMFIQWRIKRVKKKRRFFSRNNEEKTRSLPRECGAFKAPWEDRARYFPRLLIINSKMGLIRLGRVRLINVRSAINRTCAVCKKKKTP